MASRISKKSPSILIEGFLADFGPFPWTTLGWQSLYRVHNSGHFEQSQICEACSSRAQSYSYLKALNITSSPITYPSRCYHHHYRKMQDIAQWRQFSADVNRRHLKLVQKMQIEPRRIHHDLLVADGYTQYARKRAENFQVNVRN